MRPSVAVVGCEHTRPRGRRGHPHDGLGVERRPVAEHDERPVGVLGQRGEAGMERRRLAVAPRLAHDRAGAVQVDRSQDVAGVRAEDDDPVFDSARGDGHKHPFEHRQAVDRVQLLPSPEAAALACREDNCADHTSSTIESAICSVRAAARPNGRAASGSSIASDCVQSSSARSRRFSTASSSELPLVSHARRARPMAPGVSGSRVHSSVVAMMRYSWTRTRWSGTVRSRATRGAESVGAASPRAARSAFPHMMARIWSGLAPRAVERRPGLDLGDARRAVGCVARERDLLGRDRRKERAQVRVRPDGRVVEHVGVVEERPPDVLEVGDGRVRQDELGLRVVLDEVLEVLRDRRQAAPGMDQDRHAPLGGEPEHRIEPALAEIEFLCPRVQLDPLRPVVEAAGGLGDRIGGQVEPAEGDERAVRGRRPLEHAVVRHPVGREAVGIVEREREAAIDAVPPHRIQELLGRLREAVLVDAEVRMRVPDADVVGERRAYPREMLCEEAIEPRRGHGRTLPAGG